jgi:hypothetical protein
MQEKGELLRGRVIYSAFKQGCPCGEGGRHTSLDAPEEGRLQETPLVFYEQGPDRPTALGGLALQTFE